MQKVTELTTEPIIGKFYLVPCVFYQRGWWPIIGEPHSDPELGTGAKNPHWHYDIRFFSESSLLYESIKYDLTSEQRTMSYLIDFKDQYSGEPLEVVFKRLKCKRKMPEFKLMNRPIWQEFHNLYIGKSVKCGKCPHRGMPLESLPKDKNGNVVCNGHGLLISMAEKKVLNRYEVVQS